MRRKEAREFWTLDYQEMARQCQFGQDEEVGAQAPSSGFWSLADGLHVGDPERGDLGDSCFEAVSTPLQEGVQRMCALSGSL